MLLPCLRSFGSVFLCTSGWPENGFLNGLFLRKGLFGNQKFVGMYWFKYLFSMDEFLLCAAQYICYFLQQTDTDHADLHNFCNSD